MIGQTYRRIRALEEKIDGARYDNRFDQKRVNGIEIPFLERARTAMYRSSGGILIAGAVAGLLTAGAIGDAIYNKIIGRTVDTAVMDTLQESYRTGRRVATEIGTATGLPITETATDRRKAEELLDVLTWDETPEAKKIRETYNTLDPEALKEIKEKAEAMKDHYTNLRNSLKKTLMQGLNLIGTIDRNGRTILREYRHDPNTPSTLEKTDDIYKGIFEETNKGARTLIDLIPGVEIDTETSGRETRERIITWAEAFTDAMNTEDNSLAYWTVFTAELRNLASYGGSEIEMNRALEARFRQYNELTQQAGEHWQTATDMQDTLWTEGPNGMVRQLTPAEQETYQRRAGLDPTTQPATLEQIAEESVAKIGKVEEEEFTPLVGKIDRRKTPMDNWSLYALIHGLIAGAVTGLSAMLGIFGSAVYLKGGNPDAKKKKKLEKAIRNREGKILNLQRKRWNLMEELYRRDGETLFQSKYLSTSGREITPEELEGLRLISQAETVMEE